MIKTVIRDLLTGYTAKVDEDNAILVKSIPIPTVSTRDDQKPFAQLFTDTGLPTGNSNMNVDGSVTSREFKISSSSTGDRYITNISFTLTDNNSGSVKLNVFGGLATALTNGVKIFYQTEKGTVQFQQGIAFKSNFEILRLCLGNPAFGTGADAYKLQSVSGVGAATQHGYFPILDIRKTYGFQWGIRLRQSADQKLIIQINDNLLAVGGFTAYATGFDLAPIS